jgi:hypothetical protein
VLFKKFDKADPLKFTESERLLRATGYIRDAKIIVKPVPDGGDSVDVEIFTQDYWSIQPYITATTSKVRYRAEENNFVGLGHTLDLRVTDQLNEGAPLYLDARYKVPTIGRTYISPSVFYGTSADNNIRGLSINRPFYSALTRVAAGFDILSVSENDSTQLEFDTSYHLYNCCLLTVGPVIVGPCSRAIRMKNEVRDW